MQLLTAAAGRPCLAANCGDPLRLKLRVLLARVTGERWWRKLIATPEVLCPSATHVPPPQHRIKGAQLIHVAARAGCAEGVSALLDHGATVNAADSVRSPSGMPAQATRHHNAHDAEQALWDLRTPTRRPAGVDTRPATGLTTNLSRCCSAPHSSSPPQLRRTPLHYAVRSGHFECVRALLERGAAVSPVGVVTDMATGQQARLLLCATELTALAALLRVTKVEWRHCCDGGGSVVALLIEANDAVPTVSSPHSQVWLTPLGLAHRMGRRDIEALLLAYGAKHRVPLALGR